MLQAENQPKTSSVKIAEALELLNEAAKEKKGELKELFTDKYSHIKQAIAAGTEQGKQIFDKAKHLTKDIIVGGEENIKKVVGEADKRVHKDPWPYIAGAAAFSLLLGYLMGSKRR
ncbi:MAG: DUF883 domain-containing protein [Candidatus Omnitrophica bacterium]|nr:DUF883 domain-containing protein [Candidatus Omnitrophota bacterium]